MDFCAVGNAVVDAHAHVTTEFLEKIGLQEGDSIAPDHAGLLAINEAMPIEAFHPGGSAANCLWTLGKLGHSCGFIGKVANDAAGQNFYASMQNAEVLMPEPVADDITFQIFVLLTANNRSFVYPPRSCVMAESWLQPDWIQTAKTLIIEGYTLLDQATVAKQALQQAKTAGTQRVLTLGAPAVLEQAAEALNDIIHSGVDLIFTDDDEWEMLQRICTPKTLDVLQKTARVTTHSGDGATYFDTTGREVFVPCEKIEHIVDATGAGDTFAAGFLSAQSQGLSIENCLQAGHKLAGQVIMQVGGRNPATSPQLLAA